MSGTDEYYTQHRPEMLRFIPPSTRRLLDIGCGNGRFGEGVKRTITGCETWGVEAVAAAAASAAEVNDRILCGSIYELDLPAGYFDVVTMNDVLEHLPDSERALAVARRVLRPEGLLVMSLPNVRYYLNVRDLIFAKDWKYEDFGILDRTHLRFFTQKSAVRLLEENGLRVTQVLGINAPKLKAHYRAFFALTGGFFDDMRFPQFALVATPTVD